MQEQRFNRELGMRIRAARKQASLTQEVLARAVGLSRGSIANIERGDQAPPTYRLALIAQVLKVDLLALLPGSGALASQLERLRSEMSASKAQAVHMIIQAGAARSKRRGGAGG